MDDTKGSPSYEDRISEARARKAEYESEVSKSLACKAEYAVRVAEYDARVALARAQAAEASTKLLKERVRFNLLSLFIRNGDGTPRWLLK